MILRDNSATTAWSYTTKNGNEAVKKFPMASNKLHQAMGELNTASNNEDLDEEIYVKKSSHMFLLKKLDRMNILLRH